MKCKNCGTEFSDGVFCPSCGTKFDSAIDSEGNYLIQHINDDSEAIEDFGSKTTVVETKTETVKNISTGIGLLILLIAIAWGASWGVLFLLKLIIIPFIPVDIVSIISGIFVAIGGICLVSHIPIGWLKILLIIVVGVAAFLFIRYCMPYYLLAPEPSIRQHIVFYYLPLSLSVLSIIIRIKTFF